MAENKQEKKKSQQNLLSYVSHNLTNKSEKPRDKERSDSKSSTGRESNTYADKASATSATSGQKQQRPRSSASANGYNTQSTSSSNSKQSMQGGGTKQGTARTVTPVANQTPKTRTPLVLKDQIHPLKN